MKMATRRSPFCKNHLTTYNHTPASIRRAIYKGDYLLEPYNSGVEMVPDQETAVVSLKYLNAPNPGVTKATEEWYIQRFTSRICGMRSCPPEHAYVDHT
jgi:hypothetical protein